MCLPQIWQRFKPTYVLGSRQDSRQVYVASTFLTQSSLRWLDSCRCLGRRLPGVGSSTGLTRSDYR